MIQITLSTNTTRKTVTSESNVTVKKFLETNNVDYTVTSILLDGAVMSASDLNSTFSDLNITEKCYLLAVVKTDNR